jgi:hypothetical protein
MATAQCKKTGGMTTHAVRVAIDAHVHLHSPSEALSALRTAQNRLAAAGGEIGVLMLAERQGYDVFDSLRRDLIVTDEPESLWFDESRSLLVLAGRQIVSSEKLEILALATNARMSDGAPAEKVIDDMDAADAIVVLPWGVGKWLGKRGALVDRLISSADRARLFLGDNGGRPALWRVPQFDGKLKTLAGSDPLPLPGWPQAIGSFGSAMRMVLEASTPSASLKRALRDPATPLEPFGSLANPFRFLVDQTRLRLARSNPL